ncbi:MAG TPA: thiamine pyrophosphate-binding protein [Gemmataceae bacterium]|jgi:benzoylformate decarboxylase|nr:thiamine pyrophosphate-binding protein [Gemmataceae bacterium]
MTGVEAFLEVLAAAGVKHIFGNPGTTELPLNDALVQDRRFQYILGLHEIPVVAMADGYAQASGGVGVANVHISCGLGNAMGMLYNAHCAGTPVLLTAGQQDRRLIFEEPVLAGDLVSVARPWTKWAAEVRRVEDVPTAVRRAIQTALTPPTGPVFLALPVDVQMEACDRLDLSPPCVPDRRVRPAVDALRRAAALLGQARQPAILAGSRVTEAGAVAELVAVAERLGAPVLLEAATAHGRIPFPTDHPLYADCLPLWSPDVYRSLAEFDVLLVAGVNLLRSYIYHEPARPIPEHLRLVQMDDDPWQIGKNYPVEVGLLGDLKTGLAELGEMLAEVTTASQAVARARVERYAASRRAAQEDLRAKMAAERERRPMTPLTLMGALARVLPRDAAVVEEAVTTTNTTVERLGALADPAAYFGHRGWALGWGLGCALGVKLAWPDRPVLAILGDGSAIYGIQGLWSAAHHRIPVTFVICNNAQYLILKHCGDVMPLPRMAAKQYLGMDLVQPEIDFVGLARALGVEARHVTEPEELSERVQEALAGDGPVLCDVAIAR